MSKRVSVVLVAAFCALSLVAMLVLFVFASLEQSLLDGLAAVSGTLWGVTTLVDLAAGILFVATWIALLERSVARTAPWLVGLGLLGNFTTLVYVLVRCRGAATLCDVFFTPRPSADGTAR
jgi:hypothetical protein